jgi:hypothetical protein
MRIPPLNEANLEQAYSVLGDTGSWGFAIAQDATGEERRLG